MIGIGNIGFVHASSVYNGKISGMKLIYRSSATATGNNTKANTEYNQRWQINW